MKSKLYSVINEPFDDDTLHELAVELNEYSIKAYKHFLENNTFTDSGDSARQMFLRSLIVCTSKYIMDTNEKK